MEISHKLVLVMGLIMFHVHGHLVIFSRVFWSLLRSGSVHNRLPFCGDLQAVRRDKTPSVNAAHVADYVENLSLGAVFASIDSDAGDYEKLTLMLSYGF